MNEVNTIETKTNRVTREVKELGRGVVGVLSGKTPMAPSPAGGITRMSRYEDQVVVSEPAAPQDTAESDSAPLATVVPLRGDGDPFIAPEDVDPVIDAQLTVPNSSFSGFRSPKIVRMPTPSPGNTPPDKPAA